MWAKITARLWRPILIRARSTALRLFPFLEQLAALSGRLLLARRRFVRRPVYQPRRPDEHEERDHQEPHQAGNRSTPRCPAARGSRTNSRAEPFCAPWRREPPVILAAWGRGFNGRDPCAAERQRLFFRQGGGSLTDALRRPVRMYDGPLFALQRMKHFRVATAVIARADGAFLISWLIS